MLLTSEAALGAKNVAWNTPVDGVYALLEEGIVDVKGSYAARAGGFATESVTGLGGITRVGSARTQESVGCRRRSRTSARKWDSLLR